MSDFVMSGTAKGLVCESCRGRAFYEDDEGSMVCRRCETVSQEYRPEASDVGDLTGRRLTKRSRTTSRRAAPKITGGADIDAGAVPRDTQTACMAVSASMMAAQMKALQMHGAPAALEPMLRDLFLWYMTPRLQNLTEETVDWDLEDVQGLALKTTSMVLLTPRNSLALCCIGLWQLRTTVMVPDVLKLVLAGVVPYFTAFSGLGKQKTDLISPRHHKRMYPPLTPDCDTLRRAMVEILSEIGINALPPAPPNLVQKYARELGVPREVKVAALRLLAAVPQQDTGLAVVHRQTPPVPATVPRKLPHFAREVIESVAYLVVAFKVCYGLDGTTEFGLPAPETGVASESAPAVLQPFEEWTRTVGPGPKVNGGPVPLTGTIADPCDPALKGKGRNNKPAKRRAADPAAFDPEAYAGWCKGLFGKHRRDRTTHGRALQEFGVVFKALAQDLLDVADDAEDLPRTTDAQQQDDLDSDSSAAETQPVTKPIEPAEAGAAGAKLDKEVPRTMVNVTPTTAVLTPTLTTASRYITLKDMRQMRDGALPHSLSCVLRLLSRHVFASEHDLCKAVEGIEARCDAFVEVKKDHRKHKAHVCRVCKKCISKGTHLPTRDAQIAKHKEDGCHPPLPPRWHSHRTAAGKFFFWHEDDAPSTYWTFPKCATCLNVLVDAQLGDDHVADDLPTSEGCGHSHHLQCAVESSSTATADRTALVCRLCST